VTILSISAGVSWKPSFLKTFPGEASTVERDPVGLFVGEGGGGTVVVQVDELGEEEVDDFSGESGVGEVPGEGLDGAGEGEAEDPVLELLHLPLAEQHQ
jgi:hypothetical protein